MKSSQAVTEMPSCCLTDCGSNRVLCRTFTALMPLAVATASVLLHTTRMLVNWAVGEDAPVHAPGTAKRVPAGSTLIFQVHYTTNGTPGKDRSKIGLIFAKEPPRREVRTGIIANATFAIPPGAADHQVEAEATFSEDVNVCE